VRFTLVVSLVVLSLVPAMSIAPVPSAIPIVSLPLSSAPATAAHPFWQPERPVQAASSVPAESGSNITNETFPCRCSAPNNILFDPDNGYFYVANGNAPGVTVYNGSNESFVGTLPVPGSGFYGLALDSATDNLYVSGTTCPTGPDCPPGYLYIVNLSTDAVLGPLVIGGQPVGGSVFDPLNGEVYITNYGNSNVSVVNAATNTIAGSIPVGTNPLGISLDPANGNLYVMDRGANNVTVINGSTDTVVGAISTGIDPDFAAYVPTLEELFVSNSGSAYLTVINTSTDRSAGDVPLPNGVVIGVLYDPQNGLVFVAGGGNPWALDPVSGAVLGAVPLGIGGGSSVAYQLGLDTLTGVSFVLVIGIVKPYNYSIAVIAPETPLGLSIVPLPAQIAVGNSVTTAASVTCTSTACASGASYRWHVANSSIAVLNSTTGSSVGITGVATGQTELTLAVTLNGYLIASETSISVDPDLEARLTPMHSTVDANATVTLQTSTSGGVGAPYGYLYSESSPSAGCVLAGTPEVYCTPTATGAFNVSVTVTDAGGDRAVARSGTISVDPELRVSLSASNATLLLGQSIMFVSSATGGRGPYSFTYTGLPPGCVDENQSTIGCLPTQAGSYNITVFATDENDVSVNATVPLLVFFDFNVIVSSTVTAGTPFTIRVNLDEPFSGRTSLGLAGASVSPSYNYSGLPPGCNSQDVASLTCTTDEVGTYHITVSVRDQSGDHNSHTVVVTVLPEPSSFLTSAAFYAILGGAVAVVAAIAVVAFNRRRRRSQERPQEPIRVSGR